MKKIWIGLLALELMCYRAHAQQEASGKATEYAQTITAAELARHLRIIASDSLQGRETGEPGQKMAADYIANEFFTFGLKPLIHTNNATQTYYQSFTLTSTRLDSVNLAVNDQALSFSSDFLLFGKQSLREEWKASLVFAGYGLEEDNYSDYAKVDVKDKIALIFLGVPKDKRGRLLASEEKNRTSSSALTIILQEKAQLARQKGATQVLFIDEGNDVFGPKRSFYAYSARQTKLGFKGEEKPEETYFVLSTAAAADLLRVSESKLLKQVTRLGKKKKPSLKERKDANLQLLVERREKLIETENVLGLVEGSDKKEEVVVVTAHYDHLGKQGDVVYNGANDDGSGTVAILELARTFARAKDEGYGPRRSLLFMTVTGEEKGLLGSEYYTTHPVIPLQNTVADLNIDMIGRADDAHQDDPGYIYVIGADKLSSDLHRIVESANQQYTHLNLDYRYNDSNDPNRFYYRSDHYNFARYKIPVAFYFNGVHADYHQPTDDVEKMDFNQAATVTRLVFYTAWELANREERIKVDSNKP